jgi:DNA-binding response OmpR family regulator
MSKILVIDDAHKIRNLLVKMLSKENYEVREASNGIEAIIILEKENIDLVLMDIVMPNLGGLASLIGFKELFGKTKVVLMTGKLKADSEELEIASQKLGVRHILFKPFRREELLELIRKLLSEKA